MAIFILKACTYLCNNYFKLVLVQRKNCNKTTFVFNMLYVRWCSACVEGAFKY